MADEGLDALDVIKAHARDATVNWHMRAMQLDSKFVFTHEGRADSKGRIRASTQEAAKCVRAFVERCAASDFGAIFVENVEASAHALFEALAADCPWIAAGPCLRPERDREAWVTARNDALNDIASALNAAKHKMSTPYTHDRCSTTQVFGNLDSLMARIKRQADKLRKQERPVPEQGLIDEQCSILVEAGYGRDEAVKRLRAMPAFSGVTVEHARSSMKGKRKPGRPKKSDNSPH